MKRILSYALYLMLCLSCQNRYAITQLVRVESSVYDSPEQVLLALSSMDSSSLRSAKVHAQYTLLKALALNRQFSDTTNLNVILPAKNYYEHHGPDSCRMKVKYCEGWLYYNRNDMPSAYVCLKDAEKYLTEETDPHFKVMLYSAIGSICGRTNRTGEWLNYVQKWLPESAKTKRVDWTVLGLMELSGALANNRQIEEADNAFNQAIALLDSIVLRTNDLSQMAHYAIAKTHTNPSLSCMLYERLLSSQGSLSVDHYHAYAYALLCCDRGKEGLHILDSLQSCNQTKETFYWKYKVARWQNDYLSALDNCEKYCALWGQELTDNLNQSIYKSIADHNASLADQQVVRTERLRLINLLIIALALALLGFMSLLSYRRKVHHQAERERLETIAETAEQLSESIREDNDKLQSRLEEAQQNIEILSGRLDHLRASYISSYQNQLAELGRLCEIQVMRNNPGNTSQADNSRRMEELMAEIAAGPGRQANFEAEINRNLDNAVARFRSDFPKATDRDVLFLCYMLLRFDTSTIALLTGLTKENVRQKRHRLLKMMDARPESDKELYRQLL